MFSYQYYNYNSTTNLIMVKHLRRRLPDGLRPIKPKFTITISITFIIKWIKSNLVLFSLLLNDASYYH